MKHYRCYFLDRRGGIVDVTSFVSADDDAALGEARARFARQSDYPSFEIWERARLVHRETGAPEAAADPQTATSA